MQEMNLESDQYIMHYTLQFHNWDCNSWPMISNAKFSYFNVTYSKHFPLSSSKNIISTIVIFIADSRMMMDEVMHFTHATHLNSNGLQE
jgi:hypothetical protein